MLDEIERFLSQTPTTAAAERVLATVLTVNAESRTLDWSRCSMGPGRAVRCGCSVSMVAGRSAIGVRAGVHIGECDPTAIAGPLLDISAGLAAAAAPGEVLVSRTVVELVPGSGLEFADRGTIAVRGIERAVPVLGVTRPAS